MKKIVVVFLLVFSLAGCVKENKLDITGKVDIENAYKVQVTDIDGNVLISDSLKNGSFSLVVRDIEYPKLGYLNLYVNSGRRRIRSKRFVIENADFEVTFKNGNIEKVKGGELNEELINSWEENPRFLGAMKSWDDFKHSGRYIFQSSYTLPETKKQLKEIYNSLRDSIVKIQKELLESKLPNSSAAAQLIIIQQLGLNEYNREFLDNIEKELGKSDALEKLRKEEKYLLKRLEKDSKLDIGKSFIDFEANTNKSGKVKFSDIVKRNKYTLLNFENCSYWGSCDQYETHRNIYKEFKDKGFEIVSFSMNENRKNWMENIRKENITWVCCSDQKSDESPIVKSYRVRSLPTNLLIDRDGKIIAKDLKGNKLINKLNELLAS